MRPLIGLSLMVVLAAGCAAPALDGGSNQHAGVISRNGPEAAAALITPETIHAHLAFLASDEMRGRDTPSPELEIAAEYIEDQFKSYGLRPGGEGGGFQQRFALQRRALDPEATRLNLIGSGGSSTFEHGVDYAAFQGVPNSIRAEVVEVDGEITPETAGIRGAIALTHLQGPDMTRDFALSMMQQRRAAQAAGAAGVIFVVDPGFPQRTLQVTAEQNARPRGLAVGETRDIPAFLLTDAAAKKVAEANGGALQGVMAEASAPVKVVEHAEAPNVIGILPGSDPDLRDTYVVFSAHFDHIGVGRPDETGDSIYNGADDNASGTSGLLEVAKAFAALPEAPARSLLFLAVSGEEKGLLGSEYYSDNPTVPIENIVANINVDMIGRNAPDSIVVIGQEYSSLGPLVQEVAAAHPELGLTVAEDIWPEQRFFFRSDHYNFARKEIPALFFFAGVHEDYHRPSDHVEKIDLDKNARVAKLVFYTAYEIASRATPPAWTEEGLREVRAMTSMGR